MTPHISVSRVGYIKRSHFLGNQALFSPYFWVRNGILESPESKYIIEQWKLILHMNVLYLINTHVNVYVPFTILRTRV